MDQKLKDKVIISLSVLSVVLFISTVSSCNNSLRQKKARDKEMYSRIDFEEKASKVSQEQSKLVLELKSIRKELESEKASLEVAKKALVQEQMINQSLKEELQKVTKAKEALEDNLKEALTVKSKK